MKRLFLIIVSVSVVAGAAVAAPERPLTDPSRVTSASGPAAAPPSIRALFDVRGGAGAAWSADGQSVVVSTNLSGRYNLWSYPARGGEPTQLTRSDERQYAPVASADGATIVFQSDRGGGEHYDLFAVPAAGGLPVDLTNTPDETNTGPQISPDSRLVAYANKPAAQPMANIAVLGLATHRTRLLTHETDPSFTWEVVAWSRDGVSIIANRSNRLHTRGSVWRIDVASGEATELTAGVAGAATAAPEVLTEASDISPDGRWLAVASNAGSEQPQAALYDIANRRFVWLGASPWEEFTGRFSPDGHWLTFGVNADGRTTLLLYDVDRGTAAPLALPQGVNGLGGAGRTDFSPDSRSLLVQHAASNSPAEYWIYDIAAGQARQLTRFAPPGFDGAALPASQLVHYSSTDGVVVSAFLWVPAGLKRDGSAPGVVLPHGGPTAQTTDVFNRTAVALASRGYVVIAPNVRGSTGYGRAFQAMNIKKLGGGDLVDEIFGGKFMISTGYVDPKRIGITGGSYGGFMTLMAIGKTPRLWAAAVEQYGIIDWRSMLAHEDPALQAYEKQLLGDPVADARTYANDSPITFIRNATAPLLVLQGDNDIRVPKEEAEQVVAVLKAKGRIVDAHYYPNEGHGFARQEDQIDALERTVAWFDKYLRPAR